MQWFIYNFFNALFKKFFDPRKMVVSMFSLSSEAIFLVTDPIRLIEIFDFPSVFPFFAAFFNFNAI